MRVLIRRTAVLCFFALLFPITSQAVGFQNVTERDWGTSEVRKVLQAFAYGGFATDQQIEKWARMAPDTAIVEMLTFEPVNEKLSPIDGDQTFRGTSLEELQEYWASNEPTNPVLENRREYYFTLFTNAAGTMQLRTPNLQTTWIQAVNTHGLNPFLHKVGLYLTNYHMAISVSKTRAGLMRSFYDDTLTALQQYTNFFDVLAAGASSAAVARAYGHQNNIYRNWNHTFRGNDDFAREFHQLFFKIQGTTEDPDYHENTTIEHTAWTLTGMNIDRNINGYGSDLEFEWFVAPIVFTDHQDETQRQLNNVKLHYDGCLEILHQTICGATADEKIFNLARVAGYYPDSLDNLPVAIIDFFADDNLNPEKIRIIREAWRNLDSKNLLEFLREYAISTTFHSPDTVKYRSSFDRNLLVQNQNTIDNAESFVRYELPKSQMAVEGAQVFEPAHDVFGGQTGLQAANNPNIFRDAYQRNVINSAFLDRTSKEYTDNTGASQQWKKDWGSIVPNDDGKYEVEKVARWLWQRFTGDRKNFQFYERLQVQALLATGLDFGYLADPANPEINYSKQEIDDNPALKELRKSNEKALLALNSDDPTEKEEANRRVGLAVNFITVTPFMFALEGK
jgi:hypothetical protein